MHLAENIRDFYFAHFAELSPEKQFHFCTRLAAWNNDPRALAFIDSYKPQYVPTPSTKDALREELEYLIANPPVMPANAAKLREPYFAKYSWLRGLELALFRVRHWLTVYGVDARPALFEIISRKQLLDYEKQLLEDAESLRFLSTYAINYIYLVERLVLEHHDADAIDVAMLIAAAEAYDTNDMLHLQLLVYYYTHCIIADTNFYKTPVPGALLPTYLKMLQTLDTVIDGHFESLSLDTKLEFLVCCRLCDYTSPVTDRIFDECTRSISPNGTFIVDTHNTFADRESKKTIDASEHRNVLFVLASQPWQP